MLACKSLQSVNVSGTHLSPVLISKHARMHEREIQVICKQVDQNDLLELGLPYSGKTLNLTLFQSLKYKNVTLVLKFLSCTRSCATMESVDVDMLENWPILMEGLMACRSISELSVVRTSLGDSGAVMLSRVMRENRAIVLSSLVLNNCGIGVDGVAAILEVFSGTHLELKSNKFDAAAAPFFAGLIQRHHGLESLVVAHNTLGPAGVKAMVNSLRECVIDRENVIHSKFLLDLTDCNVGAEGAKEIGEVLKLNPDLGVLRLADNSIGDEGVKALILGLKDNHQITELNLDQNEITDAGLSALAGALNNKISTLSLNNNLICGEGVIDLADGLLDPNSLTSLFISDNPLGMKAVQSFQIALQMSNLTKLSISFQEDSQAMEKALVDLVCEVKDRAAVA